jgi:hypothetical protein
MLSRVLFLLAATATLAQAQWRVSAGYAPMIGLKAEFKGFGNFQNPFPVPALGTAGNFNYTNGFVRIDSSGNAGGLTTFWSYNSAAQVDAAAFSGLGGINFTTLSGGMNQAGSAAESNVAAGAGFDLRADLRIGALSFLPSAGGRTASWGLHTGLQYARVDVANSDSLSASLTSITDSFALPAGALVLLPAAPFAGSFLGPNLAINDGTVPVPGSASASRTFGTSTATITGTRDLEVQMFIARFGSYVDIPITEKIDLNLEGGFLVGLASGSYDWQTTVNVPGVGTQTTSGHSSHNRLLPGFYAGLGLTYNITPKFGIMTSARYQYMRQFDLIANGSDASLNFSSAFTLSLAAVWKF